MFPCKIFAIRRIRKRNRHSRNGADTYRHTQKQGGNRGQKHQKRGRNTTRNKAETRQKQVHEEIAIIGG